MTVTRCRPVPRARTTILPSRARRLPEKFLRSRDGVSLSPRMSAILSPSHHALVHADGPAGWPSATAITRRLAASCGLSDSASPPRIAARDGSNFHTTKQVTCCRPSNFAAITGAGPIIGPVLARSRFCPVISGCCSALCAALGARLSFSFPRSGAKGAPAVIVALIARPRVGIGRAFHPLQSSSSPAGSEPSSSGGLRSARGGLTIGLSFRSPLVMDLYLQGARGVEQDREVNVVGRPADGGRSSSASRWQTAVGEAGSSSRRWLTYSMATMVCRAACFAVWMLLCRARLSLELSQDCKIGRLYRDHSASIRHRDARFSLRHRQSRHASAARA